MEDKDKTLHPIITDEAKKEVESLISVFKEKMKLAAEETIDSLYCDISNYIESDSWSNFRNEMMEGFMDYHNNKVNAIYDFKKIRNKIFEDNREEIIKDLDKDILAENDRLKSRIKFLEDTQANLLHNV